MQPFLEDGELVGAGTSYGLLTRVDGRWVWAPTAGIEPRAIRAWERAPGSDRVLLGSNDGTYFSHDDGCSWSRVDGELGASPTVDFALGEGRSATLFAATERADGDNDVWRSDDGGATWSSTGFDVDQVLFNRMVSSNGTVAVEGFERAPGTWSVWMSGDDGETWQESPSGARLLGARDGDAIVAVEDGDGWAIHPLDASGLGPMLAESSERPESAGFVDETLWYWAGEAVVDGSGRARVDSAHCLLSDVSPDAIWLCESTVEDLGGHFLRVDATGREALVDFRDVTPIECADGSETAQLSQELWPSLRSQGVGPSATQSSVDDSAGCGCSTVFEFQTAATGFWTVLLSIVCGFCTYLRRSNSRTNDYIGDP
jgi:hypothetical protein